MNQRLGFHNDCFLADNTDQGTYLDAEFDYPYLGNGESDLDPLFPVVVPSADHLLLWTTQKRFTQRWAERLAPLGLALSAIPTREEQPWPSSLVRTQLYNSLGCTDQRLSALGPSGFHWRYLHIGYNADVINKWKEQGCFDDITKQLGYRLLLSPSATHTYTSAVRPGTYRSLCIIERRRHVSLPPKDAASMCRW